MTGEALRIAAPAKVNLYLAVGQPRDDGYHEVETVMQTLELCDTVTMSASAEISVVCDPGVDVPSERNLAWRAARALAEQVGRSPDFAIRIDKRIPAGGGLGGGSADAAAVLAGLAHAWGIAPADPVLVDVAAGLGADVPFFLTGGCALMGGRGDELAWRLPTPPLHMALVNPGIPVPTAEAYAAFDASPAGTAPGAGAMLAALDTREPAEVAAALYDNLTGPVTALVPEVGEALAFVAARPGLLGSCMAGSGSTVFGVFDSAESAEGAASAARHAGWWAEATRTRHEGVVVVEGVEGERS